MKKWICLILTLLLLTGCGSTPAEETTAPSQTVETTAATEPETEATTEASTDATEKETTPAPDFTVQDGEGNEVKLSDFFGKPIVLNFWASWCGPCKSEMPEFDEVYLELQDEVVFLMVNLTDGSYETLDTARSFVEQSGYSFPVYYDTAGNAANTYGINSIPTTYFIDAEGGLVAYGTGAIDEDTLRYGISMITGE